MNYRLQSEEKLPLLQRAVVDGHFDDVRLLVERGAELDLQDSIGRTAFYEALTTMQPETAISLMERGANFETTDNGATPAWSVHRSLDRLQAGPVSSKFEELRDLMIAKGAKWPPDPPEVVRDERRAKGMRVVMPVGQKK